MKEKVNLESEPQGQERDKRVGNEAGRKGREAKTPARSEHTYRLVR